MWQEGVSILPYPYFSSHPHLCLIVCSISDFSHFISSRYSTMGRPAWLAITRQKHTDDQDIGLLENEPKFRDSEDQQVREHDSLHSDELGTIRQVPARRSLLTRISQHVSLPDHNNLLPAWLRKRKERRIHPTSYLDGLRGAAAFFVFIHHSSYALFPGIRPGFGAPPTTSYPVNHNYFIQLPFVRILYSGSVMVDIFFVISGAVLSLKPLRLGREGRYQELLENLSSSAFRRGPRLFLPCFVSTFFTAVASMLGFMLQSGITRNYPLSPSHSWTEQFRVWLTSMVAFCSPSAQGTIWEQNLWTIPMEFRGSILVFLCALGVAKLRSQWLRTTSLIALNCYWVYLGAWEAFLFLSGMLISEFSLYRRSDPQHRSVIKGVHGLLIILALYLISMPERVENVAGSSFGYGWLWNNFSPTAWANNVEPGRFWPCVGAVLFISVQTHAGPSSWYQRLFTTRLIQYLGEVSFSFYLWHGLLIYTVGARVMTLMLAKVGSEGAQWWLSLFVTEMTVLPTLFWISDLSTIYVDRAAVNLGKFLINL